jgi:hypothetical protein
MAKFDDTLWFGTARYIAAATSTEIFGPAPDRRMTVIVSGSGISIDDFGVVENVANRTWRFVLWGGVNTIVNGVRNLCSSGADIVTAPGDLSLINGDTDGNCVIFHFRALGMVADVFTVATLPAAGTIGRKAMVSDATTPAFLAVLTGGGAVLTPVFDDGTVWRAG